MNNINESMLRLDDLFHGFVLAYSNTLQADIDGGSIQKYIARVSYIKEELLSFGGIFLSSFHPEKASFNEEIERLDNLADRYIATYSK